MVPGRLSILLGAVLLLGTGCTSADDPPVPFLQAFHRLETTRQKVHHLRTWHHELGAPNGLGARSAQRFQALLEFFLFPHVTAGGVLDCAALAADVSVSLPCFFEIDEPGYRLYTLVVDDLCPAQHAAVRAGCVKRP